MSLNKKLSAHFSQQVSVTTTVSIFISNKGNSFFQLHFYYRFKKFHGKRSDFVSFSTVTKQLVAIT